MNIIEGKRNTDVEFAFIGSTKWTLDEEIKFIDVFNFSPL